MEWADDEPLARRWRWVLPEKTGWFHILSNPVLQGVAIPAMNQVLHGVSYANSRTMFAVSTKLLGSTTSSIIYFL